MFSANIRPIRLYLISYGRLPRRISLVFQTDTALSKARLQGDLLPEMRAVIILSRYARFMRRNIFNIK
jgi:hypothetical protein